MAYGLIKNIRGYQIFFRSSSDSYTEKSYEGYTVSPVIVAGGLPNLAIPSGLPTARFVAANGKRHNRKKIKSAIVAASGSIAFQRRRHSATDGDRDCAKTLDCRRQNGYATATPQNIQVASAFIETGAALAIIFADMVVTKIIIRFELP
jgi:hypothetical protein